MMSGQEPHQPDADSEPRQEDPGGGGAQASLDLPEGEGGLCIPQVRPSSSPSKSPNSPHISGKRLWTA